MVRNIFITNDNRDNISIYEKEPVYVVNFEKKDFDKVNKLFETKQAGIYILIGENKRYVGQASVGKRAEGVKTRLIEHEKSKEWWTSCIFFGRNDGLIDKSQLDYLEDYYIERFVEAGFDMDNNKKGNTSAIQKLNKIKADEMRDIFEEILEEVANFKLLENSERELDQEEFDPYVIYVVAFDNQTLQHSVARRTYTDFVKELWTTKKYREKLKSYIIDDRASYKFPFGSKPNIGKNGSKDSIPLEENVHLYTCLSVKSIAYEIEKIAGWLDLPIKKNF